MGSLGSVAPPFAHVVVSSRKRFKKKIIMKSVVSCLVLFCVAASASAFEADDVDPRTITVSGSNVYLALNTSTLLLGGLALLTLLAVGALAFGLIPAGGASVFEKQGNSGYENYYDPDLAAANSPHADAALAYAYSAHQQQQDYRQKRSLGLGHNLSTKMSQLEQAIKKYGNDTEECQKYIACVEAATADCAVQQNECISSVNSRQ